MKLSDWAVADGRQLFISTEAGSTTAVCDPESFSAADVGKNIVIAKAGAGGAKLSTTIASVTDSATVELVSVAGTTQTGIGASLGTDCSAGMQAAFDALGTQGGGVLEIDGVYLLAGTVYKNFFNLASSLWLKGNGSNSAIIVACAGHVAAITFGNLIRGNIEGIDFVGTPNEPNDARYVLDFETCLSIVLEGNSFYGLSNIGPNDSAVVYNNGGGLNLLRNNFGGCIIATGGVVLNNNWQRFESQGNRFIDFGNRNGTLHSKTPLATGQAWIKVGEATPSLSYEYGSTDPIAPYPHATVRIDGDFYDEGTKNPVLVASTANTKRIAGVRIAGCRFNVNGYVTGSTGPAVLYVNDVEIVHCSIGYVNAPRYAIYLNTVPHARIVGVVTNGVATALRAITVGWLEVVNSPTLTNDFIAVTRHTVNGV